MPASRFLPTTKKEQLKDRIHKIEDEIRTTLADPVMSSSEKLFRQGALIQAYREAYKELNKPIFAPPFTNEYVGSLPKDERNETSKVEDTLAKLFEMSREEERTVKREEEEDAEEEEVFPRRLWNLLSPNQNPRASIGSSQYESPQAPFATPPLPHFQKEPTPVPTRRVSQGRSMEPTLASLRQRRPNFGEAPERLDYVAPGHLRRPRPYTATRK